MKNSPSENSYLYKECGLNVTLFGILPDPSGDMKIPNIHGLHKEIASNILTAKGSMSGKEFRFLRTEAGLKREKLAKYLKRTVGFFRDVEENNESMHVATEALFRMLTAEILKIDLKTKKVLVLCNMDVARTPIHIDCTNPEKYKAISHESRL